jgi:hypothetical protein
MNKIIKSQDGQQIHFMPISTQCYFSIAPVLIDGEKEGKKTTLYSVGINNVGFGTFKKRAAAESAFNQLEKFLLNKEGSFQIPADK